MRLKKITGFAAGALVAGAMAVPALVAPAQAAPVTGTGSVDASCTYSAYTMNVKGPLVVTVDGSNVTVAVNTKTTLGSDKVMVSKFGVDLVANVDGESVALKGEKAYDAVSGDELLDVPVAVGTRTASTTPSAVTISSVALFLKIQYGSASVPCVIKSVTPITFGGGSTPTEEPVAAVPVATSSTIDVRCSYTPFFVDIKGAIAVKADGDKVTATISAAPNLGSAAVKIKSMTMGLDLGIGEQSVSVSGSSAFSPEHVGNVVIPMPAFEGTIEKPVAVGDALSVDALTAALSINFGDAALECAVNSVAPAKFVAAADFDAAASAVTNAAAVVTAAQAKVAAAEKAVAPAKSKVTAANAKVAKDNASIKTIGNKIKAVNKNKKLKKAAKAKQVKALNKQLSSAKAALAKDKKAAASAQTALTNATKAVTTAKAGLTSAQTALTAAQTAAANLVK